MGEQETASERSVPSRVQRASDVVLRRRPEPIDPPPSVRVRPNKASAARTWLITYLTERGGTVDSAVIRADAAAAGHPAWALRSARLPGIRIESVRGVSHRTAWVLTEVAATSVPAMTTSRRGAREWLAARIETRGGRAPSHELKAEAAADGYRPRMVERARVDLGLAIRTIPGVIPRRTEWTFPDAGERSADADVWLTDFLARSGGSVDSGLVRQVGARFGHNARTLDRARLRRGVRSEVVAGSFPRRTVWVLDVDAP